MTDYINFQTWICPKCYDDHSIFADCTPVEIGVFMPSETDKSFIAEKYREQNAKIKELEAKLEILRMQLVACGVAALQNTEKSKVDRITKDNPYYSASYKDVCDAVDREIDLRAKLEIAVEALEFYADGDSWGHVAPGTHYVTNVYQCVDKTDYGEGDFTISERMNIDDSGVGGRRARQALEKLRGEV